MPTKARRVTRSDLRQGKTIWHLRHDEVTDKLHVARVQVHSAPCLKKSKNTNYLYEVVFLEMPTYDSITNEKSKAPINARAVNAIMNKGHGKCDLRNSLFCSTYFTSYRAAMKALKAIEDYIDSYKGRNIHTIGVYPNGDYHKTNSVQPEHMLTHVQYNFANRPGRTLVVDGKVFYKGLGVSAETTNKAIELYKKNPPDLRRSSAPYQ